MYIIITELGPNWSPGIPKTVDELDNITQSLYRTSSDMNPYWIGGSCNSESFIEYPQYRPDESGE